MSSKNSETALNLKKWNEGDLGGLEALLEKHLPWIQNHVRLRLGSKLRKKTESSDIVQDAIIQFMKYGPRIQLSSSTQFRALMTRIVENVVCDEYDRITSLRRKISRERPLPTDTVLNLDLPRLRVTPPHKNAQRHENEAWIRLGIELLSNEDRQVLTFRAWGDLSFSEIGSRLDISENTARMRFNRAILRLAKKIGTLRRGGLDNVLAGDLTED